MQCVECGDVSRRRNVSEHRPPQGYNTALLRGREPAGVGAAAAGDANQLRRLPSDDDLHPVICSYLSGRHAANDHFLRARRSCEPAHARRLARNRLDNSRRHIKKLRLHGCQLPSHGAQLLLQISGRGSRHVASARRRQGRRGQHRLRSRWLWLRRELQELCHDALHAGVGSALHRPRRHCVVRHPDVRFSVLRLHVRRKASAARQQYSAARHRAHHRLDATRNTSCAFVRRHCAHAPCGDSDTAIRDSSATDCAAPVNSR